MGFIRCSPRENALRFAGVCIRGVLNVHSMRIELGTAHCAEGFARPFSHGCWVSWVSRILARPLLSRRVQMDVTAKQHIEAQRLNHERPRNKPPTLVLSPIRPTMDGLGTYQLCLFSLTLGCGSPVAFDLATQVQAFGDFFSSGAVTEAAWAFTFELRNDRHVGVS